MNDGRSRVSRIRAKAKFTPKISAVNLPLSMNKGELTLHTMLKDGVRNHSSHVDGVGEDAERALLFVVMASFRACSGALCYESALYGQIVLLAISKALGSPYPSQLLKYFVLPARTSRTPTSKVTRSIASS